MASATSTNRPAATASVRRSREASGRATAGRRRVKSSSATAAAAPKKRRSEPVPEWGCFGCTLTEAKYPRLGVLRPIAPVRAIKNVTIRAPRARRTPKPSIDPDIGARSGQADLRHDGAAVSEVLAHLAQQLRAGHLGHDDPANR